MDEKDSKYFSEKGCRIKNKVESYFLHLLQEEVPSDKDNENIDYYIAILGGITLASTKIIAHFTAVVAEQTMDEAGKEKFLQRTEYMMVQYFHDQLKKSEKKLKEAAQGR